MDPLKTLMDKHARETREAQHYRSIYRNDVPLAPMARELADLYRNLPRLNIGHGKTVVDTTVDRVRVTGMTVSAADPLDNRRWAEWNRLGMDRLSAIAQTEAGVTGRSYLLVGVGDDGQPRVTAESSDQVTVLRDPATGSIEWAMKRFRSDERTITTELMSRDELRTYATSTSLAADPTAEVVLPMGGREQLVSTVPNPLGRVPLVMLANQPTVAYPDGRSDLADVEDLLTATATIGSDLLVASAANAIPHRVALVAGEMTQEQALKLQQILSGNLATPGAARVGVLSGGASITELSTASLDNFDRALRLLVGQIAAVSGLPPYYTNNDAANPTSADSVRAQESRVSQRVKARQRWWGPAYADLMRLVFLLKDGYADPALDTLTVTFEDPEPASISQQADAVQKLAGSVLDRRAALEILGASPMEIERQLSTTTNPPTVA